MKNVINENTGCICFFLIFTLMGCETADGVKTGVKSIVTGVSADYESAKKKY